MRDLNFQLKKLCQQNREGSYQTRANRAKMLMQIANQLHELGYCRMQAKSLKPKHIDALVNLWQSQSISSGTIKNRMAVLRWWADKVNKRSVIAQSNGHYDIIERQYISNTSKAQQLDSEKLVRVKDDYVRMSLELQQAFGLRREEAIKFCPAYADHGDKLILKPSWTKGGRAREIPICNQVQRDVLNRAQQLTGRGTLIPSERSYIQQLRIYERYTANAGLSKLHGLRHCYAQHRYEELTGWKAPAAGGPTTHALSLDQKEIDREVRAILSSELGHDREQITAVYLGK